MPLYEYECGSCGRRFERIQKFSDPPLETCPHCGAGPVKRLISSPAIHFKGSGWYINDYARKGKDTKDTKEAKGTKEGTTDAKETKDAKDTKETSSTSSTTSSESKPAPKPSTDKS